MRKKREVCHVFIEKIRYWEGGERVHVLCRSGFALGTHEFYLCLGCVTRVMFSPFLDQCMYVCVLVVGKEGNFIIIIIIIIIFFLYFLNFPFLTVSFTKIQY